MTRDLTSKQFERALVRHNFGRLRYGFFGCVHDNETGYNVCPLNAGDRRRDQLAYLLQERAKWLKRSG
jgi:hypothetical protein